MSSSILYVLVILALLVVVGERHSRALDLDDRLTWSERENDLLADRVEKYRQDADDAEFEVASLEAERLRLVEAKAVAVEFHLVANRSRIEILDQREGSIKASTQGAVVVRTLDLPLIQYGVGGRTTPEFLVNHLAHALLANMKIL